MDTKNVLGNEGLLENFLFGLYRQLEITAAKK